MSNIVFVGQAKKSLYWIPVEGNESPPMPFMVKGDLRILRGKEMIRTGFKPIKYSDDNFRIFIPIDMLRLSHD